MHRSRGCLSLLLNLALLFLVLAYVVPRIRGDEPSAPTERAEVQRDDSRVSSCMGTGDPTGRDVAVTDLDLDAATAVTADSQGGVWVAVGGRVVQITNGQIGLVHELPVAADLLAAGPGGELAARLGSGVFVFWADGARYCTTLFTPPDGMWVNHFAITGNGDVLVTYSGEPDDGGNPAASLMAVIGPDGHVDHMLGSAMGNVRDRSGFLRDVGGILDADDAAAQIQLDEPLGAITSLATLPDGRVAFTIWNDADLRVMDGAEVSRVATTPEDSSRRIRLTGSTPDGRLLGVAWGNDVPFQIKVINADTGATETVADLEELADLEGGDINHPLDATAVGNDVVFLAGGRLWRMADVFG